MAALRGFRGSVFRLGHRLHLPDLLHPRRPDGAHQRPQPAAHVHHLQYGGIPAGHGGHAIHDPAGEGDVRCEGRGGQRYHLRLRRSYGVPYHHPHWHRHLRVPHHPGHHRHCREG